MIKSKSKSNVIIDQHKQTKKKQKRSSNETHKHKQIASKTESTQMKAKYINKEHKQKSGPKITQKNKRNSKCQNQLSQRLYSTVVNQKNENILQMTKRQRKSSTIIPQRPSSRISQKRSSAVSSKSQKQYFSNYELLMKENNRNLKNMNSIVNKESLQNTYRQNQQILVMKKQLINVQSKFKLQNRPKSKTNLSNKQKQSNFSNKQKQSNLSNKKKQPNHIKSNININKFVRNSANVYKVDNTSKNINKRVQKKDKFQKKLSKYLNQKDIFSYEFQKNINNQQSVQKSRQKSKDGKTSRLSLSKYHDQKKHIILNRNEKIQESVIEGKKKQEQRNSNLQIYKFYKKTFDINLNNCMRIISNTTKGNQSKHSSSKSTLQPSSSSVYVSGSSKNKQSFKNKFSIEIINRNNKQYQSHQQNGPVHKNNDLIMRQESRNSSANKILSSNQKSSNLKSSSQKPSNQKSSNQKSRSQSHDMGQKQMNQNKQNTYNIINLKNIDLVSQNVSKFSNSKTAKDQTIYLNNKRKLSKQLIIYHAQEFQQMKSFDELEIGCSNLQTLQWYNQPNSSQHAKAKQIYKHSNILSINDLTQYIKPIDNLQQLTKTDNCIKTEDNLFTETKNITSQDDFKIFQEELNIFTSKCERQPEQKFIICETKDQQDSFKPIGLKITEILSSQQTQFNKKQLISLQSKEINNEKSSIHDLSAISSILDFNCQQNKLSTFRSNKQALKSDFELQIDLQL